MTDDRKTLSELHEGDTQIGAFLFKNSIPAEVRQTVHDAFTEFDWLVPGWCQLIAVHWGEGDDKGASISIHLEYEYRWASVTVYPCWLNSNRENRRDSVVHEILHIHTNILYGYATETLSDLLKEESPKHFESLQKELLRRCESATQDLAYLIQRKIPPA